MLRDYYNDNYNYNDNDNDNDRAKGKYLAVFPCTGGNFRDRIDF